jgi:IclR family pca regulon transcriptional regulator
MAARAASEPGREGLRPSDLVHHTGLARATIDRVLATLIHLGYVRAAGRELALLPRLLELGNAYLTSCGIPEAVGPHAERLSAQLAESVSVAVPDADGVRFVVQVSRRRTFSLVFRVGDLLPAERCAAGALFARQWTDEQWQAWRNRRRADPRDAGFPAVPVRAGSAGVESEFVRRTHCAVKDGWAVDDQLVEPGLIAVSVPVVVAGAQVCAASVVSHTSRHDVASLAATVLPRLREVAADMSRDLVMVLAHGHVAAPPAPGAADRPTVSIVSAKAELGAGYLQSLARGLAVLCALGGGLGGTSLTQVAETVALPRATARRSLLSLAQLGYVAGENGLFRPLPRVLELGYAPLSRLTLAQIVQPHLERLVDAVSESASATVLDGDDIRYIARVPTYRIMSVDIRVGTRFPAYATSMGRVLLAGLTLAERRLRLRRLVLRPLTRATVTDPSRLARILDDVATNGYALVDEELEDGLRSLAVPVRDASGAVVAAVNLSTHTGRGSVPATLDRLLAPLRAAATAIEADLRCVGRVAD